MREKYIVFNVRKNILRKGYVVECVLYICFMYNITFYIKKKKKLNK